MLAVRRYWLGALLAVLFASPSLAAAAPAGFTWESDLEAAKLQAARSNRLVLIHFGAPWCQPCQQLERDVFSQPGFGRELASHFVGVKLNYDSFPATARQYGVQSIPSDVIITPQGQMVERVQSALTGPEYSGALVRVASLARGGGGQSAAPGAALASSAMMAQAVPQAVPQAAASTTPPPSGTTSGERYADFFNQPTGPKMDTANNPYVSAAQAPVPQTATAPNELAANPQLSAPPGMQPGAPPTAGGARPAAQLAATPPQLPPGNAPLGLEGFCPVSLSEKRVWVNGDLRWGMQHHGRTYLFAGPDEQQKFQANPERYSPVMSGNDPVLALDQGQSVAGSRMYGVSYSDHVYLFMSEQTLQIFQQNPKRYAAEAVQARH